MHSQVEDAYAHLIACSAEADGIAASARLILAIFDDFYRELCEYPYRAKRAFERMDPHTSIQISQERLGLYSRYISEHGPRLLAAFPALAANAVLWEAIDRLLVAMIVDRYEADIVFSLAHSLRRNIDHGIGVDTCGTVEQRHHERGEAAVAHHPAGDEEGAAIAEESGLHHIQRHRPRDTGRTVQKGLEPLEDALDIV